MFRRPIPISFCGVILGIAALGNLLRSISQGIYLLCGITAGIFLCAVLANFWHFRRQVLAALSEPVSASVFCTLPMAITVLSGYAREAVGNGAVVMWYCGVALHVGLMIWFSLRHLPGISLEKVHASFFVVYVGVAAGCIPAAGFELQKIGQVLLWFALCAMALLWIPVALRYFRRPPEWQLQPLQCICAAPFSLCLAGYFGVWSAPSAGMVGFLAIGSAAAYLVILLRLPSLLRRPFCPAWSAFTFPLVISTVAMKQCNGWLMQQGISIPGLSVFVWIQTALAVLLTCLVLAGYRRMRLD